MVLSVSMEWKWWVKVAALGFHLSGVRTSTLIRAHMHVHSTHVFRKRVRKWVWSMHLMFFEVSCGHTLHKQKFIAQKNGHHKENKDFYTLFVLSHEIMTSNSPLLTSTSYKRQIYMITSTSLLTFLVEECLKENMIRSKLWHKSNST